MRSLLWSEIVAKVVLNGEYSGVKDFEVDFSNFSKGGENIVAWDEAVGLL
jgi:hypothetical protein